MLFSQPDVAKTMGGFFECVWEELRPAPRVSIDFGNGYKLERTLVGNVATLFCTPEGEVYDVLPSIMTKEAYQDALAVSAARFHALPSMPNLADQTAARKAAVTASCQAAGFPPLIIPGLIAPGDGSIAIGKGIVERPIKERLGIATAPAPAPIAVGKFNVENPLINALPVATASEADRVTLEKDTLIARTRLLPEALRLLATLPLCAPEELTPTLFRDVLHVDLEDPYLGLAPDVLGGRMGRFPPAEK